MSQHPIKTHSLYFSLQITFLENILSIWDPIYMFFGEEGRMKAVTLRINFAGKEVLTSGLVSYFSSQESLVKALKSLGVCWAVAALCILVPILHFVLTPAALLAGPVAAAIVYAKTQKLPKKLSGSVVCSHCNTSTTFLFENAKPSLYEMCANCRTGYEVIWPPESDAKA